MSTPGKSQTQVRRFSVDSDDGIQKASPVVSAGVSKQLDALYAIFRMVEPVEFYAIRSKPKAPSLIRIVVSVTLLLSFIGLFIYSVVDTLNSFVSETDIFRNIDDSIKSDWDSCTPITTLGSNYSRYPIVLVDDCYKRVTFNVYKAWYPNYQTCIDDMSIGQSKFCNNTINGIIFLKSYLSFI